MSRSTVKNNKNISPEGYTQSLGNCGKFGKGHDYRKDTVSTIKHISVPFGRRTII